MTKEQLKELVATKIAGQGNQVDTGSTLPAILNGIIDKLFEGGGDLDDYAKIVEVDDFEDFSETTLYSIDDIVRYDGKLYRFTENKDRGEWDEDKVEQTSIFDIFSGVIGELESLSTTAKNSLVAAINELKGRIDGIQEFYTVTISAFETADLTAEEAEAAGFTAEMIAKLQAAHNPTVEFSDMCVNFNAVEVISDDLVNQSTLIVHTAVGGGTLYKAILSLKSDGSVTYTVTELE